LKEAKRLAEGVLKQKPNRYVSALAALALALTDEAGRAKDVADELAKTYPDDTILQFNILPSIRAALEVRGGDGEKGVTSLKVSTPYELGNLNYQRMPNLCPVYFRGRAYLAQKNGAAAAAEFQKIVDHPGVALNSATGALANLGLARAKALSGDAAGARKSYEKFLSLWKEADPDSPLLAQARAESAKLK
jgi:ATP/maltotriose-dependent transcriptional regulator MalT